MGAIFGLVHLNGQPVSAAEMERMNVALAAHGPDGNGVWTKGQVGLGQRLMRFTPEDRFERQPLLSADGQRVLVSDGRIDNRPELMRALDITPAQACELPDSAFILSAYEKWSDDCARHLVGTFTFALWNAPAHRLLLTRSPLGARSLFYHVTPTVFAFASMPKGLFALPFVPREINPEFLADYLTMSPAEPGSTFFRDIRRLTGGYSLVVSREGVQLRQYWQPDLNRELRLPRDDDYVEMFTALFERVVADQLRSLTPVGVMMSGGLDSTSVAATAAPKLKREGKRLAAFTQVPPISFDGAVAQGRYADERPFVQPMACMYDNLDVNFIRTDGRVYFQDVERFFVAAEIPFLNTSNRDWYEEIFHRARQQGVRVLLTGSSGNLTMSWGGEALLPTLLRGMKWTRALNEARALARNRKAGSTLRTLVGQGLMPLLPNPLWFAIERVHRRGDARLKSNPPWRAYSAIHPHFASAQKVAERARAKGHDFRSRPTADRRTTRFKTLVAMDAGSNLASGYQAIFGVELRDPTGDLRIVEFCLSLPEEQFLRNGQSRWLLRRAMADRLPQAVLSNKLRGMPAADWFERLRAARTEILNELNCLERSELAREALDLSRLRRLAEQMPESVKDAGQRLDYRTLDWGLMAGRFLRWFEAGA